MKNKDYYIRGLIDIEVPVESKYINKGLRYLACYPSHKPGYEILSIMIADLGKSKADCFYISIHKPEILETDYTSTSISKYQKDLIYEYTSSHWEDIIRTMKDAYANKDNVREFGESKDISIINFPTESPDYRTL